MARFNYGDFLALEHAFLYGDISERELLLKILEHLQEVALEDEPD